ncbi:hypothetical protein LUZ60_015730 [Juncus effusus]|nr:hypothetical protein LUZ60_015730 [Juncus effusus]
METKNFIEIGSSSSESESESDSDIEIGVRQPAWTNGSSVPTITNAPTRILPPSFTNGTSTSFGTAPKPYMGPSASTNSTSFAFRRPPSNPNLVDPVRGGATNPRLVDPVRGGATNPRLVDPVHGGPSNPNPSSSTRVLPPSLMGGSNAKSIGTLSAGTSLNGTSLTNGVSKYPSILPRLFVSTHSKPSTDDNDDVMIIGNRTGNPNPIPSSVRVLPPSMGFRASGSTNGVDLTSGPSLPDDRRAAMDCDERVIYQEALQNLGQPKLEDDLAEGILSVPLLKHQKIALAWMVQKEKSSHCAGGILADDQGLGKTVSTIALIEKQMEEQIKFASNNSQKSESKPEALLDLDEDETTEPSSKPDPPAGASSLSLSPAVASSSAALSPAGTSRLSSSCRIGSHVQNVRLPAGTLVVCPASVMKQWANELADKVTEAGKLSVLVYHGGARTRDPSELAKFDVVVTTYTIVTNEVPKQSTSTNNDEESNSNLERHGVSPEFGPSNGSNKRKGGQSKGKRKGKKKKKDDELEDAGPLARVRWFRVVLDEAQTIKNHRTQVAKACSGLRAKRRWCLSGTPIQNTIDDLYSYFRFLKYYPYSGYSSFCTSIKHPISRDSAHGYRKLQAVLKTVLLRRTKDTLINGEPIINLPKKEICLSKVEFSPEERAFYVRLEERSRQQFKAYAAAGTVKQNYANILLMLLRLRQACDHPLLAQGYQSNMAGHDSFDVAKNLPRDLVMNLLYKLQGSSAICAICSDPPEDAVVSTCGHVFCYQCVHDHLSTDAATCPALSCSSPLSSDSVFSRSTLNSIFSDLPSSSHSNPNPNPSAPNPNNSLIEVKEKNLCNNSYVSSKIRKAMDVLVEVCGDSDERGPFKAIVFSQWTSMLDLMEISLNQYLIQYRRLDGSMSLVARDRAVKDFNSDPEVKVMIMSLKAGNLGLNMVAACHVILLDLWWNPYAEDQAVDRAHRIGQTRSVKVSRLTVQETVEDRILALQEEKRNMVSSAFGEDKASGHATRLTVEDLRYLFMV